MSIKKAPKIKASVKTEEGNGGTVGQNFPVVGIGASAGGLRAFESFFSGMPKDTDPGMAFVLVQHLAPDHKSILAELVGRYTRMQVVEAGDGMKVEPNCAYIIPPNHDMAFMNGALHLLEPIAPRGHRLPIDYFFRSLAQDLRERAICVVLSGTGSDGSTGVRAIKGEGGMVMAQSPDTTEFDGMPRNAISTGLVDYVLPPEQMAQQLIAYSAYVHSPKMANVPAETSAIPEEAIRKVFVLLRLHTGHDFSLYKQNTIARRLERRMAVHQIDHINDYVRYLQQNPEELEALFRDLLIGVTSFFRDPEVFDSLEKNIITRLIERKPNGGTLRVWVPGCSTGEEAYSIAILLQEAIEKSTQRFKVQIFATDIDSRAVTHARAGVYPSCIKTDITPRRLQRFFSVEASGDTYRVASTIREMLIFSEQDLIKDPPFSKVDLISCRNLLIYMGKELQGKVIPLFHYALNHEGFLMLGTSETTGSHLDLFEPVDRKAKLYRHRAQSPGGERYALTRFAHPPLAEPSPQTPGSKPPVKLKDQLRELTERTLLTECSPAGVLITERGDILYLHGRTGLYLEPVQGEAGMNIFKMAREGLKAGLSSALHQASTKRAVARHPSLRVKTNGDFTNVKLAVIPVSQGSVEEERSRLFLVALDQAEDHEKGKKKEKDGDSATAEMDERIALLTQELRAKEEYLHTYSEELQTSNEDLKSSNEEMQSMNEELQSANEELETSKEELQSINEELATVNAELQSKVSDLSRVNNDMSNLLAGTDIGIIFVDHDLKIQRFTPMAAQVVNLIDSDIGRPMSHLASKLNGYGGLVDDIRSVLATLDSKEFEVQASDGRWFFLRIRPYRTIENTIEGAVLTFTEITASKEAQKETHELKAMVALGAMVRDSRDAVIVRDRNNRILSWNPTAEKVYGWMAKEAMAFDFSTLIPEDAREQEFRTTEEMIAAPRPNPFRARRITKDGRVISVWVTATGLLDLDGGIYAIATMERPESGSSNH